MFLQADSYQSTYRFLHRTSPAILCLEFARSVGERIRLRSLSSRKRLCRFLQNFREEYTVRRSAQLVSRRLCKTQNAVACDFRIFLPQNPLMQRTCPKRPRQPSESGNIKFCVRQERASGEQRGANQFISGIEFPAEPRLHRLHRFLSLLPSHLLSIQRLKVITDERN